MIGDLSMLITVELHIAKLRIRQGDHRGARAACGRARTIVAQIGDSREAGEAHLVYGLVERAFGDASAAEAHFLRAEEIAIERRDLLLQGELARELSELYRSQGRNRQTLQRLNQAHRLFTQLRARRELADVDRRATTLENDFLDVVRKWGESIESKDRYTQGHCLRVADLACALWTRVNSADDTSLFWFRIGALLHDVGKLMVPAELLNKPGKLTDDEWKHGAPPSVGRCRAVGRHRVSLGRAPARGEPPRALGRQGLSAWPRRRRHSARRARALPGRRVRRAHLAAQLQVARSRTPKRSTSCARTSARSSIPRSSPSSKTSRTRW